MITITDEAELDRIQRERQMRYVVRIPKQRPDNVPADWLLVHNHIRHTARTRVGHNGFRAWFAPPNPTLVQCDCGWAAEFGQHYRVHRPKWDPPIEEFKR